jgi:hypothetical protein
MALTREHGKEPEQRHQRQHCRRFGMDVFCHDQSDPR